MSDRSLRRHLPTSVERAGKIGRYYELSETPSVPVSLLATAIADLDSDPRIRDAILDIRGDVVSLRPNGLEKFIGYVEAKSAPCVSRCAKEGPPTIDGDRAQERFWLASLIALQAVRGESFRERLNEVMRAQLRERISAERHNWAQRWRQAAPEWQDRDDNEVIEYLFHSLDELTLGKMAPLGEMLPMAFNEIGPRLFGGIWRVLAFGRPDVLTSDEGVGLWGRPDRDTHRHPLAIATADSIYFPLDCRHTLQMLYANAPVDEGQFVGADAKLRHSNNSVASAAYRWIFSHPGSAVLSELRIERRPRLGREEVVSEEWQTGGRAIIRFFRS